MPCCGLSHDHVPLVQEPFRYGDAPKYAIRRTVKNKEAANLRRPFVRHQINLAAKVIRTTATTPSRAICSQRLLAALVATYFRYPQRYTSHQGDKVTGKRASACKRLHLTRLRLQLLFHPLPSRIRLQARAIAYRRSNASELHGWRRSPVASRAVLKGKDALE